MTWELLGCSQPSWRRLKKLEDDWNATTSFPQGNSVKLQKSPLVCAASGTRPS